MSSTPIRTAVVGVGLAGTVFHLPLLVALPELFTVVTVVERNPQQEGGKARNFGIFPKVVVSFDEVLTDPEIELVVIGTPNTTHYPFAKAALEAGKHVLVDKPITPTYKEALELLEIAKSQKRILYAFQNRRWDSDFLTVRKILEDGTLGYLTEFESHFDRHRPNLRVNWRETDAPGSGLIYDLGPHLIDQALVLFGRPERVTAFLQNLRGLGDEKVDDSFTIFLHYSSKGRRPHPIMVILRAHPLSARQPQFRYSIKGTKATFIKEGVDVQEDQLKEGKIPVRDPAFGVEPEGFQGVLETLQSDGSVFKTHVPSAKGSFESLFRNLAAAIRKGEALEVKWEEAAAAVQIVELAKRSSLEGKTLEVPSL